MSDPSLFDEQPEPIQPYWQDGQPSAGWSGSDTSKASEQVRLNAQQRTWLAARDAGRAGVTWRDIAERLGVHHGTASGALSVLHQRGHLARLVQTRSRCKVYVLPSLIGDRDTEAPSKRVDPVAAERERILRGLAWLIAPDFDAIPSERSDEVREAMSEAAHVVLGHRWDDDYQVWHDADCAGTKGRDGCIWQRWAPSR